MELRPTEPDWEAISESFVKLREHNRLASVTAAFSQQGPQ